MSVIIKGMEMPKSCLSCPFHKYGAIDEWEVWCDITGEEVGNWEDVNGAWTKRRRADCLLVELPNTDLVDADTVEFWGEHEHGYRWTGKIVVHRNPEDAYREDKK